MRNVRILAQALAALVCLCAGAARGDIVHFTSGGKLEGEVISQQTDQIVVRLGAGTITLRREMVARIEPCPSPQAQYRERLSKLQETAAGHLELARWCEEKSLPTEARDHYIQVILLDPENASARAALGFIKVGQEWLTRSEARQLQQAQAGAAARQGGLDQIKQTDNNFFWRRDQWRKKLRDLDQKSLGGWIMSDEFLAARKQALAIKDPAAVEPLVETLVKHGDAVKRTVAVEVLANIGGDVAALALVDILARDPDAEVAATARAALAGLRSEKVLSATNNLLRSSSAQARDRAAQVLGDVGPPAMDSVLQLICNLITRDEIIIHHEPIQAQRAWIMDGTAYAYVQDLEPVVAEGAVAWRPIIGYLVSGAILDVRAMFQPFHEHVWVTTIHPDVLNALQRITGQDFGYDIRAWRYWYFRQYLPAQAAPPEKKAE